MLAVENGGHDADARARAPRSRHKLGPLASHPPAWMHSAGRSRVGGGITLRGCPSSQNVRKAQRDRLVLGDELAVGDAREVEQAAAGDEGDGVVVLV